MSKVATKTPEVEIPVIHIRPTHGWRFDELESPFIEAIKREAVKL